MRDWLIAETDPPHWQAWGQLHEAVRSGRTAVPELFGMHIYDYYAAHPADLAYFSRAMGNVSAQVAGGTVQHYDFSIAASFPERRRLARRFVRLRARSTAESWPELQSNYAAGTRRVSAGGLAPTSGEIVMQIQLGSSRSDSLVRILHAQPRSPSLADLSRSCHIFAVGFAQEPSDRGKTSSGAPKTLVAGGVMTDHYTAAHRLPHAPGSTRAWNIIRRSCGNAKFQPHRWRHRRRWSCYLKVRSVLAGPSEAFG